MATMKLSPLPEYIDELLLADSSRIPMFMDGTAGNHLTMALLSLWALGADESEVRDSVAAYMSERAEQLPELDALSAEVMSSADDIDESNWTDRLGDRAEVANLRRYFQRRIGNLGMTAFLEEVLPVLEPWLHYGQAHPLLRMYFPAALVPQRPELLADGLVYLAAWANPDKAAPAANLPDAVEQWTAEDLAVVWADILGAREAQAQALREHTGSLERVAHARDNMDQHPHHDLATVFASGVLPTLSGTVELALTHPGSGTASRFRAQDLPQLIPKICQSAVALFLAVPRGSTLHGVTVTQALAHWCAADGQLSDDARAALWNRAWVWLTGLFIDKNTAPAVFASDEAAQSVESNPDWQWDRLSRRAIELDQVHISKLVFACRWLYENQARDPLYRLVAARCIEGGHPWRADVDLACDRLLALSEAALAFRAENKGKAVRHVANLLQDGDDDVDPWELAWRDRSTPWDISELRNAVLGEHTRPPQVAADARCLVPGCGAGRDVIELAEGGEGRVVHGIEIARTAADVANGNIELPRARAEVYAADFFTYRAPDGEPYDLIFDYTFFCALPLALRADWGSTMATLARPGEGELLAYVWPPAPHPASAGGELAGPPFPVHMLDYVEVLAPNGFRLEQAESCEVDPNRHAIAARWRRSHQSAEDIADIERVYGFWFCSEDGSYNFNAPRQGFGGESQGRYWMMTIDEDNDRAIRDAFGALHERLEADEEARERWMETPRGCIALTILMDQLPRNMYRGSPRSFATDPMAREAAEAGMAFHEQWQAQGNDLIPMPLNLCERWFLSLAFTHSEALEDQHRGLQILQDMLPVAVDVPADASPEEALALARDLTRSQVEANIKQGHAHIALIEEYGRFPYRDEILGRETAEGYEPTQRFEKSVRHDGGDQ